MHRTGAAAPRAASRQRCASGIQRRTAIIRPSLRIADRMARAGGAQRCAPHCLAAAQNPDPSIIFAGKVNRSADAALALRSPAGASTRPITAAIRTAVAWCGHRVACCARFAARCRRIEVALPEGRSQREAAQTARGHASTRSTGVCGRRPLTAAPCRAQTGDVRDWRTAPFPANRPHPTRRLRWR
jgi:hypothetical protein